MNAPDRLTRKSIAALVAAWFGWGFDVFDALLFSYVAKPTFASLLPGATDAEVNLGLAVLSSLFLVGWATGGILFGRITDRLGRTRTLLFTMVVYSVATAACALAPNVWMLGLFRVVASLGVGGEWAAGASLVSESLPDRYRVWGGALLFTASPMGLVLANLVNQEIVLGAFAGDPDVGWRVAFAVGLVPAVFAFTIRLFVREPERFVTLTHAPGGGAASEPRGRVRELFHPRFRRRTWTGLALATVALILWWGVGVFLPKLLPDWAHAAGLGAAEAKAFAAQGNDFFNVGGVVGALLTAPLSLWLGRRATLGVYFLAGFGLLWWTFRFAHSADARLALLFALGCAIFGIFGVFAFYLPELFPTRLRGTGAGFCYNTGRYLAAAGPLLTGSLSVAGTTLAEAMSYIGFFAIAGFLVLPFSIETRGRPLED
jgi:MFS family permease